MVHVAEPMAIEDRATTALLITRICTLLQRLPYPDCWTLAHLNRFVLPAVALGQFRLFESSAGPIGLSIWGRFSDDAWRRLHTPGETLALSEWQNGDQLRLVRIYAEKANYQWFADHASAELGIPVNQLVAPTSAEIPKDDHDGLIVRALKRADLQPYLADAMAIIEEFRVERRLADLPTIEPAFLYGLLASYAERPAQLMLGCFAQGRLIGILAGGIQGDVFSSRPLAGVNLFFVCASHRNGMAGARMLLQFRRWGEEIGAREIRVIRPVDESHRNLDQVLAGAPAIMTTHIIPLARGTSGATH